MTIRTRQGVVVSDENDIVTVKIGRATARFSYQTAFRLAQHMRLNAKCAMRVSGIDVKEHRSITARAIEKLQTRLSRVRRASRERPNLNYEVTSVGESVHLQIGNIGIDMDHDAALEIAGWIREHGRKAKRWAGDTGKSLSIVGHLSDAEENYRLGH